MTVRDLINTIHSTGKIIENLLALQDKHQLNAGEKILIEDTIAVLDDYIDELKEKQVK